MKFQPITTPIQRPATRLEQARDQMLVALERAVNQGNILHCFPAVQRARTQADSGYAAWLAQLSAWEVALEAALQLPIQERGRDDSPLLRKGEAGLYPQGERIVLPAEDYHRYGFAERSRFCDLPENEQVITDDELQRALQRVRAILASPPAPPAFEVSASLSWSPKIGSKRYADLSLILRFPGERLTCTPGHLNHLFRPANTLEPQCEVEGKREVELYIWACPQQFSFTNAVRLRTQSKAFDHPFSPRPLEMYILTPSLAYVAQLTQAKIGVIGYDPDREAVYIPEVTD